MPFTEQGYHRLTYAEWLEQDIDLAKKIVGDDIDTSETTLLGKYIRLSCEDKRDLSEDMEDVYLSISYLSASGAALKRHLLNVGVTASAGIASRHMVTLHGTAGYTVAPGLQVCNSDKTVIFHTINECIISDSGTVQTEVECNSTGENGNLGDGEINTILYSNAKLGSVTDSKVEILGEGPDSDTLTRKKYEAALKALGSGTYEAIKGSVYRVTGVSAVNIDYNNTMKDVPDGLPAKTFRVSVLGDPSSSGAIAKAIFSKKPIGAKSYGDVSEEVIDEWGGKHTVRFSWITQKVVYVYVKMLVDSDWGSSSVNAVKTEIASHINNLSAGGTVYLNDIYTALKGITGKVNVLELKIGESESSVSASNMDIPATMIARTTAEHITVETESV